MTREKEELPLKQSSTLQQVFRGDRKVPRNHLLGSQNSLLEGPGIVALELWTTSCHGSLKAKHCYTGKHRTNVLSQGPCEGP